MFFRPPLCNAVVQSTVQFPARADASTDPNLSRSCQSLRVTTRAIRDLSSCPSFKFTKKKIRFKTTSKNNVQYEWGSLEQSSSECRCLYVTKRCLLLPSNLLQLSSMAETRYHNIIILSRSLKSPFLLTKPSIKNIKKFLF